MLPRGLLKEHFLLFEWLHRALDVAVVAGTGLAAYCYKFGCWELMPRYGLALIISAILTMLVFPLFHIYQSVRTEGFAGPIYHLTQALLTVFMLLAGLAFLSKTGQEFSRQWFMEWAGSALFLLIVFRVGLLVLLRAMRAHGWNERRVIIIGAGPLAEKLIDTVQHALWTGLRVVAILDEMSSLTSSSLKGVPVIAMPASIQSYLDQSIESIDEIWLALPLHAEARLKTILHELRHDMRTTRLVLDVLGLDLFNYSMTHLGGFPIVNINTTPMRGINRLIKAVEDRVLASLILFLISPLFLVIGIAIKLSSRGTIFYRQKRMSWNGKEFEMLKFRTMPMDAEDKTGPVWATAGEKRATKIGAFLRKTSLDELPQFINVLWGEMSIVGPRPEREIFVEQFKDQIPNYMRKHLVKAGITGWAQVHGFRGNTSLEKRIEYDLDYIENWSLLLDLKIIFLTIFRGFINKNAY